MSLTTGEMSAADLAAVVGNSNGNDGFGGGNLGWQDASCHSLCSKIFFEKMRKTY